MEATARRSSAAARAEGGAVRFHVEERDRGLEIRIEELAGREEDVLQAVRECRKHSAWACPSGECVNIASIDAERSHGTVLLHLTPRPGEKLSGAAIQECLRYILDQPAKT